MLNIMWKFIQVCRYLGDENMDANGVFRSRFEKTPLRDRDAYCHLSPYLTPLGSFTATAGWLNVGFSLCGRLRTIKLWYSSIVVAGPIRTGRASPMQCG